MLKVEIVLRVYLSVSSSKVQILAKGSPQKLNNAEQNKKIKLSVYLNLIS